MLNFHNYIEWLAIQNEVAGKPVARVGVKCGGYPMDRKIPQKIQITIALLEFISMVCSP